MTNSKMQKIAAGAPEAQSADLVAGNIAQLKALFPELLTEGPDGSAINLDVLKALVGDATVTDADEKYGLNWHGKRQARHLALKPSNGTLRPCPEDSVGWDSTQNLMVEGDNLEVLKLLQKSYAGKVKLIYIDPPYNTGTDFVYPDDFRDGIRNYKELTGQVDGEGRLLTSNSETSGRFHTEWLNMMYPRLKLARNLLADNGLLVVQISDAELNNLRRIADEIFGEENYLNTISVKAKVGAGASGGGEDKRLKKNVEFILVYAKNFDEAAGFASNYVETPLTEVIAEMKGAGQSWKYTSVITNYGRRSKVKTVPDGDGNPIDIYLHEGVERASLKDLCKLEGLSEEQAYLKFLPHIFSDTNAQTSIRTRVIEATASLKNGQMYSVEYVPSSGREKGQRACHYYISPTVRRVIWLKDVAFEKDGIIIKKERTGTLWDDIDYNNIGKEGGVAFANGKKPLELLRRVVRLMPEKTGLVLDFFAGSATTGHAVMAENAVDNGNRRFIVVQLPEPLDVSVQSQADAAQFCKDLHKPLLISELTKERIRRAAARMNADSPLFESDTGFRVFKLDTSNIRAWNPASDDLVQTLLSHSQHVLADRGELDLLYELLLKLGLDLCVPIQQQIIAGKTVHAMGAGVLLACLSEAIAATEVENLAEGIVQWHQQLAPAGDTTCVFRDSAFADDVAKTNMAAILQQHGIQNVRSL